VGTAQIGGQIVQSALKPSIGP